VFLVGCRALVAQSFAPSLRRRATIAIERRVLQGVRAVERLRGVGFRAGGQKKIDGTRMTADGGEDQGCAPFDVAGLNVGAARPCCTDRYGWPRGAPSAQEAGTGASGTVCVPPR
jgi:hypothetical protein